MPSNSLTLCKTIVKNNSIVRCSTYLLITLNFSISAEQKKILQLHTHIFIFNITYIWSLPQQLGGGCAAALTRYIPQVHDVCYIYTLKLPADAVTPVPAAAVEPHGNAFTCIYLSNL